MNWHNNPDLTHLHTQSTRVSNAEFGGYGGKGGMNERYDLYFVSENMLNDANEITYIKNSYKAYGNNGNCYDNRIDSDDCSGSFGKEIREKLYRMSDHLPIVIQLQTEDSVLDTTDFKKVDLLGFPNGTITKEELNINVDDQLLHKQLFIYNSLGKKLISKTITKKSFSVDTANLANGIYYLKLENTDKVYEFVKI